MSDVAFSEAEITRRQFLKGTGCAALSGSAFLMGFNRFFLATAMADPGDPNDYKALVCIFLFGGNDANNMIIPMEEYSQYQAVRGGAQFAIREDQLLPIMPPSDGRRYGLHPNLAKLHRLWDQQNLAAVVNMGTLIEPINRAQYLAGAPRPRQLFSHADQQTQYQTSISAGSARSGWGGRIADRLGDPAAFPMVTSLAGVNIFSAGERISPLVISPAPTRLNDALRLTSADPGIESLLALDARAGTPALVSVASGLATQALQHSRGLATDPTLATVFPNTSLGNQLKQVAKLVYLRGTLGMRRQVFFTSIGSFDTHTNQLASQGALFTQLSDAMAAFYAATEELGVAQRVTTFSVSDFARTFKPGGGQTGTDHAWGSHQLVMGGDVRGGDFAGTFPTLALEGPDDTDTGTGARGRWIPTSSVDQYGATLSRWFGVSDDDLALVFPTIGRFATPDLSFLGRPAPTSVEAAEAPVVEPEAVLTGP